VVIKTFPNPFEKRFELEVNGNEEQFAYRVMSATGMTLQSGVVEKNSRTMIDLSSHILSSGVYYIEVTTSSKVYQQKIMKQ
jgi:hypothetical protein